MKNTKKALLFGFLVWLIPFMTAFAIFPIHESNRPLFESIMPVAVTLATVIFAVLYFHKPETGFQKEGWLLGLLWLVICIAIDLLLFSRGPMKMTPADYMMDIGLTYLLIPVITVGMGHLLEFKVKTS